MRIQAFLARAILVFLLLLFASVSLATDNRGFLTSEQKEWLNSHASELSIAPEANYPPFSFVDSGAWRGVSADVIKQVEGKLGTKFHILPPQNLDAILVHAQRGEAGIVTSIRETPERSEYLTFTQPYVSIPTIIIVKTGDEDGHWPEAFAGKQVVVGKGYGVQKFIERNYPNIKLVLVADDLEGLRRLSFGEVDAVIMDVASASFFIEREKFTNLHIFSSFDYTYDLCFAVRKDLPILRDILSKTLLAIPDRDKQIIARKWHISPDISELLVVRYVQYWPFALAGLVLLILISSVAWFITLRRALAKKARELHRSGMQFESSAIKGLPHYLLSAIFVLPITIAVLFFIWQELNRTYLKNLNVSFINQTERVTTKIRERMGAYGQILRSGAGFFAGSHTVERDEWRSFVEKLNLDQHYRGIQGVGFSLLIPKERLNRHIKEIRDQGFPNYTVNPAGNRSIYSSIIYLEPFSERNLRAFGYDMFSEPIRNEAMSRARDTGDAALSGKVKLVQETNTDIQAGVVAYYPVYKNGAIATTLEQRRADLIGWIYSPYRMSNLLQPVLENELQAMRLEIFDEGAPSQDTLLFDSQPSTLFPSATFNKPAISHTQKIEVGGRYWTLRYSAMPGYAEASQIRPLWNELLGLVVIGLLVFSLTLAYINTRRKAEAIADDLTDSLRRSEQRWKFALEGAGDGVWDWNITSDEIIFSKSWYEIQGFDEGTIGPAAKAWEDLVHPTDLPITKQALQAHFEGKTPNFSCEHRVRCKNGEYKWILGRGMVVARDAAGKPQRAIGTHTDISERKQAEQALNRLSQEQQAMLDNELVGIIKVKDRHILWCNKAMCRIFGYETNQLVGASTRILYLDILSYQALGDVAYPILHGRGVYRTQLEMVRKDGEKIWVDLSGVLLPDHGKESMWMMVDITLIKQREAEVTEIAYHDILTGLPNRLLISDRLVHALAQAERSKRMLAVCYLDLDGFKPVNDNYGHQAGDLLLKEIASRMQASVRANDTVGRLGGDEFVLLLTDLERVEEHQVVVERVMDAINQPISISESIQVRVGASIGITIFPTDSDDPDTLLRHADQAMYQAKLSGRNQMCFYSREKE